MSALSEASTPAQDGAPPSIDTQQLQHHNQQLPVDLQHQHQQPIPGSSSAASADGSRKRASPLSASSVAAPRPDRLRLRKQPRRPPSVGPAPLATPVKLDAAKLCRARSVTSLHILLLPLIDLALGVCTELSEERARC